jgi:tetratricopeptide (TPR) repeat protein
MKKMRYVTSHSAILLVAAFATINCSALAQNSSSQLSSVQSQAPMQNRTNRRIQELGGLSSIEKKLSEDPHNLKSYLIKAEIERESKDFEKEVQTLSAAIKNISKAESQATLYALRAVAEMKLAQMEGRGRWQALSEQDMRKALQLNPLQPDANNLAGQKLLEQENAKEALTAFNLAVKAAPKNTDFLKNRALALSANGDRRGACRDLEEAAKLAPDRYDIALILASLYERAGEFKKAETSYDKAISIRPNKLNLKLDKCQFYLRTKHFHEAIKDLDKVYNMAPSNDDVLRMRGECYFNLKEYSKAIKDYTSAIEMSPEVAPLLRARAKVYRAMGKESLAKEDERRAQSY